MTKPRIATFCLALGLAACSSAPPVPDWQLNAKGSLDRAIAEYLAGDTRASSTDFDRARSEISRTGRIDLLARAELRMCAAQVASLVFETCAGFEKLRVDAPAAERAYADYLAGRVQPDAVALLPTSQRGVAAKSASDQAAAAAVKDIDDPLSRLVGAGVLFQSDRATPELISVATETASAQGWRRPLLAWLGVQRMRAEKAGDSDAAERLRRQIEIVEQTAQQPR
ncbi:MAG TPA: hypothetical protein VLW55_24965 [Burkholderiaceae bacterium]|nr:hypothetical protein [Burkholderiaceae bacterium]